MTVTALNNFTALDYIYLVIILLEISQEHKKTLGFFVESIFSEIIDVNLLCHLTVSYVSFVLGTDGVCATLYDTYYL